MNIDWKGRYPRLEWRDLLYFIFKIKISPFRFALPVSWRGRFEMSFLAIFKTISFVKKVIVTYSMIIKIPENYKEFFQFLLHKSSSRSLILPLTCNCWIILGDILHYSLILNYMRRSKMLWWTINCFFYYCYFCFSN